MWDNKCALLETFTWPSQKIWSFICYVSYGFWVRPLFPFSFCHRFTWFLPSNLQALHWASSAASVRHRKRRFRSTHEDMDPSKTRGPNWFEIWWHHWHYSSFYRPFAVPRSKNWVSLQSWSCSVRFTMQQQKHRCSKQSCLLQKTHWSRFWTSRVFHWVSWKWYDLCIY